MRQLRVRCAASDTQPHSPMFFRCCCCCCLVVSSHDHLWSSLWGRKIFQSCFKKLKKSKDTRIIEYKVISALNNKGKSSHFSNRNQTRYVRMWVFVICGFIKNFLPNSYSIFQIYQSLKWCMYCFISVV